MSKDYFADAGYRGGDTGRSVRNIPISVHRPARPARRSTFAGLGASTNHKKGRGHLLWIIAFVAVFGLLLASLTLFRGTIVTVIPRSHAVIFDESSVYTALPDGTGSAAGLAYTTATFSLEESRAVTASGSEKTEVAASGDITIYNDHQNTPLRLIKNTRFEAPNGKVYRIRDSIVVPAKTSSGPGTLSVRIYADEPGESYNGGPYEKMTLPGLKGNTDGMYEHVYAKSSTAFSGGFVGERPVIAEADLNSAEKALKEALLERAKAEAETHIDTSEIAFPQLMTVTYDSVTSQDVDGKAQLIVSATVSIPVFSEAAFAQSLALATSADAADKDIRIVDRGTFTIQASEATSTEAINFTLDGTATFVWSVDVEALAAELAGTSTEALGGIVSGHPEIARADAIVRPFWSSAFPENPSDISIIIENAR